MSVFRNNLPWRSAMVVFLPVAIGIFVLVTLAGTVYTFSLPEFFASSSRIRVSNQMVAGRTTNDDVGARMVATEAQMIISERVLELVVAKLDLNNEWGRLLNDGKRIKTSDCVDILRSLIDVRPVRMTTIMSISVYCQNPQEAAKLANAVTSAYVEFNASRADRITVEVLNSAHPQLSPVHPRKTVNIILSMMGGVVLGLGVGGVSGLYVLLRKRARVELATSDEGRPTTPPPL